MKALLIVCFMAFTHMLSGQIIWILIFGDKLSTENFQVGMNFGLNLSDIEGIEGTKIRPAFQFGSYFEIRINDRWSLQPELGILTPAGCRNFPNILIQDEKIDSLFSSYSSERRINYVSIPVLMKYKWKHFGIGLGPQLSILGKASDHFSGTGINGIKLTLEENKKGVYNPLDFGLTGLVEFYLRPEDKMRSMRISAKYFYGLTNMLNNSADFRLNNSYFTLTFNMPVIGKKNIEGK